MTLAAIIKAFGYPAIIVGTFLEGETILVLGGFAAHEGYLNLPLVILSAFLGTFAGDQLFFYLGRRYGDAVMRRFPHWQPRIAVVKSLIARYRIPFIIGFRFTYGLRTVSPFAIGMSRVPALLYVVINAVTALVWATLVGGGGYLLGNAMRTVIGHVKHVEFGMMGALVLAGTVAWIIRHRREKKITGPPTEGP
jgi:membrane protein DedA with SNARE-associated domain